MTYLHRYVANRTSVLFLISASQLYLLSTFLSNKEGPLHMPVTICSTASIRVNGNLKGVACHVEPSSPARVEPAHRSLFNIRFTTHAA
jgi:hypothetical protein